MNETKFLLIMLIIITAVNITGMITMYAQYQNRIESLQLYYNIPNMSKNGLNGIYYGEDEFYCVWTKNRRNSEINNTETHEICHWLIDKEQEHFCGDEGLI